MKPKKFNPHEISTSRIMSNDVNPTVLKINGQSPSLRKNLSVKVPKQPNETFKTTATIYKP